jgi:hypothetical protein
MRLTKTGIEINVDGNENWKLEIFTLNGARLFQASGVGLQELVFPETFFNRKIIVVRLACKSSEEIRCVVN